jgi:hypothetical protein
MSTSLTSPFCPLPMMCPTPPRLLTNATAPSPMGLIDVVAVCVSGVVTTNIGGPSSHVEVEEVSWKLANQAPLPSTVPCVSNDEDSLPH